jgi:SNF2 family DNA or RNA helicase
VQIVDNRGLLLKLRNPGMVTSVISKSKAVDDSTVLCKWDIATARTLTKLGFKGVPSPIQKYNYPHFPGEPPMAHQRAMAEFMTLHQRCFNLSEMGTAKTRAVLWAADYLMQQELVRRALILAPLSILDTAWMADLYKTVIHRTACVATGDPSRRKKLIESNTDFVIANHDCVKSSRIELARAEFDLIIVDEASAFCNATTDRSKALQSLIKPNTNLWLLTGTPAANSPLQAYGLAKMVCPDRVPKYFSGWRDKVMHKISNFTYVPKPDAQQQVFSVLQPAIRFAKKDCIELPPLTYQMREVPMDATQKKYYDDMKKQMLMYAAGEKITAANAGVLLSKLLQIAAGTVYSDDGKVIDFRATSRLNEMLSVIHECDEKVLVFAPFKASIKMIAAFLEKHGVECAIIDGDTSKDQRKLMINLFQQSDILKVLIMQPRTAAHGLTLTRASTTIWFTPVSSLEIWNQANARMDRPGQVHDMTIVSLCGSPVEKRVYHMLGKRAVAQDELLKLFKDEVGLTT